MCCDIGPDGVPNCVHFTLIIGTAILAIAVFAMIYFGAFSSPIWCGLGAAILYPGICCLKQNETDSIGLGIFLLACGIAGLLLGIFNVTFILHFNLALGTCLGIPFILSGLFCVSDYVFKRKEHKDKDDEIFYYRYMYISGLITAITCAFLVGFGVVPFATAASLAGPFICVSLVFFVCRFCCFIKSYFLTPRIKVPTLNEQNMSDQIDNTQNKNLQTPGLGGKDTEGKISINQEIRLQI